MLDDRTRLLFPPHGFAEVPLRLEPQVLRCNAAGPGGHPLTVLIDTGTDPSAIDLGLARRLDLRIGGFALGSDAASNAVPFTETVLPWLKLGELTLRDLYLHAVDLSGAPFKIDLVLGYNVLSNLVLSVDYRDARLRLSHPDLAPALPAPGGLRLPLTFYEHFPAFAGANLDDELALPPLTIDTGSNGALTLSRDLAERTSLRVGAGGMAASTGQGFTAGCTVLQGALANLRLGSLHLRDVELDVPASPGGDFGRSGRANIGNRLLARFGQFTLDYRRNLCLLGPMASGG